PAHHRRGRPPLSLYPHADRTIALIHVVRVLEVLLPGIFHAVVLERMARRALLPGALDFEWLRVVLRIFDRRLDVDAAAIGGRREAFDRMQARAGRLPARIEFGVAIEAQRVDHQGVALPASDRVPDVS